MLGLVPNYLCFGKSVIESPESPQFFFFLEALQWTHGPEPMFGDSPSTCEQWLQFQCATTTPDTVFSQERSGQFQNLLDLLAMNMFTCSILVMGLSANSNSSVAEL